VQDKSLDSLIDRFDRSSDTKERQKLSREIQEKWHEIGSWIPLYRVPYFRTAFWRFMKLPKVPATKRSAELFDPLDPDTGGMFWIDVKLKDEVLSAVKSGKKYPVEIEENKVFRPK
jgi:microcin C transport system substrate-binding protein